MTRLLPEGHKLIKGKIERMTPLFSTRFIGTISGLRISSTPFSFMFSYFGTLMILLMLNLIRFLILLVVLLPVDLSLVVHIFITKAYYNGGVVSG